MSSASHLKKLLRNLQPDQLRQRPEQLHMVCSVMLDANQLCHQVHKSDAQVLTQAANTAERRIGSAQAWWCYGLPAALQLIKS